MAEDTLPGVPPRFARLVLTRVLHPLDRPYALADLADEFEERIRDAGRRKACMWYRRQVLTSLVPALLGRIGRRRASSTSPSGPDRGHGRSVMPSTSIGTVLSDLATDVRHSLRGLLRAPLVLFVTVLSLGVGIGAATIAFAMFEEVVLQPPVGLGEPERLVTIYRSRPDGDLYSGLSPADYDDLRPGFRSLDGVAGLSLQTFSIEGPGGPDLLLTEVVSRNFFDVTRIAPWLGRAFTAGSAGDASRVVVLGYDAWQRNFSGRPEVVGETVRLAGHAFTVVGVAPRGVRSRIVPAEVDAWVPRGSIEADGLVTAQTPPDRGDRSVTLFARMRPESTIGQVQAEADIHASRLSAEYPDAWTDDSGASRRLTVMSEAASRINPRARAVAVGIGLFFIGAAGLVLLLACSNVAGLYLARARSRRAEIALRRSIGATRARLMRMMLAEGLIPGLVSGVLGITIASVGTSAISSATLPVAVPVRFEATVSPAGLAFAFLLTILASLAFSLLPAIDGARTDLQTVLKGAAAGITRSGPRMEGSGRAKSRRIKSGRIKSGRIRPGGMKNGLVVVQCAASTVLILGASLFLRTLSVATHVDLGFDPAGVAVATRSMGPEIETSTQGIQYMRDLRRDLSSRPGVHGSAVASGLALTLFQTGVPLQVGAGGDVGTGNDVAVFSNAVSDGYLEMLDVTLLRGRTLRASDDAAAERVAVVNQTFAERYWPGQEPMGRTFDVGATDGRITYQVIGVVEDGKYLDFDDGPTAFFWRSIYQDYTPRFAVLLKGAGSAEAMIPVLRAGLELSEGEVQVIAPSSLDSQISIQFIHLRVASTILGWGGLFGLLLAAIGLYGVVSFAVAQRSKEMALRMALGAEGGQVVRSLAAEGVRLALVGGVIGMAVMIPAARGMRSILFGVGALDPIALLGSTALLVAVAFAASLIPARQVTRLDPMATLRSE
jgi:predicted permease